MKFIHARQYEIKVEDVQIPHLIDEMFESDPELGTGNNGELARDWDDDRVVTDELKRALIEWLTYQYDRGNYTTIVEFGDTFTFDPDKFAVYLEPKNG